MLYSKAFLVPCLSLATLASRSIREWYIRVASTPVLAFLTHGHPPSAQRSYAPLVIAALLAAGVGWVAKEIVEVVAVLLFMLDS